MQPSSSDYCHLTGTNCTQIQSHTSLKPIQLACVGVGCVCHHHSASPEYWEGREYDSSDSLDLEGEGETCWLTGNWYQMLSSKNSANMKDRLICWFLLFVFDCRFFCHFLLLFPCLNVTLSLCPRDDNFSDTLSQKADSEASSGHAGEEKCLGKDISSPTDTRISEAYITRLVFTWLLDCTHKQFLWHSITFTKEWTFALLNTWCSVCFSSCSVVKTEFCVCLYHTAAAVICLERTHQHENW